MVGPLTVALRTVLVLAVIGLGTGAATAAPSSGPAGTSAAAPAPSPRVLVISVDALGSRAVRALGPRGAPTLHRLLEEGAGTRNARTVREVTTTLPNHTSMVTGRRVRVRAGGHGVSWNDDRRRPRTVRAAAGHPVRSVFTVVGAVRRTGLFVSKPKLALFERSWSRAIDRVVFRRNNRRLVRVVRSDLTRTRRAFTFVHLSLPDVVGHRHGFLSAEHLAAVARTDRRIGRLVRTIEGDAVLRRDVTLVVTADHGGRGPGHSDPTRLANTQIPFLVWGAGVAAGADLYDLNDGYRDPRKRRTGYGAPRQPIRNGDVANLATDLLGLDPVRGSEFDADHSLGVS